VINQSGAVLTRDQIQACMSRPLENMLFISPVLDDQQIGDSTIDIRLGQYFMVQKASVLSVFDIHDLSDKHQGYQSVLDGYSTYRIPYSAFFSLPPGQSVQVASLEYIGMPNDLQGDVTLRHSMASIPVTCSVAKIQPGYRGVIVLNLENHSLLSVNLYPGIRFAQLELRWLSQPILKPKRSRYTSNILPRPVQIHLDNEIHAFGPSVEPLIIGIVSTIGAGRTTAIGYLQGRHGFEVFSLSSELKRLALERGLQTRRSELQSLGNLVRFQHGNDYLARKLRTSRNWLMNKHPYVIVDGFKNPEEVIEFRKQERFYLIAIDAPEEQRIKRTKELQRIGNLAQEQFELIDKTDRGLLESAPDYHQRVSDVIKMADYHIYNDKSIGDLKKELNRIVELVKIFSPQ
jgi:dCTP deaminase